MAAKKEKVYVAIDSGKYATKAMLKYRGRIYTTSFRTKIKEVHNFGVDVQPQSYHIKYQLQELIIGNMVDEDFSDFSLSKSSKHHQLAIYTAISVLLEKTKLSSEVEIKLAVNVPITSYKDTNLKKAHIDLIQNFRQPICIEVNRAKYSYEIIDVVICFEGMSELFFKPDKYKTKQNIVIDIGGLNVNLCQFDGVSPKFNSMTVSDLGINILKGKIGKVLNETYGITVSANDLEQILRTGYLSVNGNIVVGSKELIEQLKLEHIQQIIQFAKSRQYTFNNADILFSGGGSLILKPYIKLEFPNAEIIQDPQFANCRSFLRIVEIKDEKKE